MFQNDTRSGYDDVYRACVQLYMVKMFTRMISCVELMMFLDIIFSFTRCSVYQNDARSGDDFFVDCIYLIMV